MRLTNDIRHGRHCVFALHVHLVFVTKYRRQVFDGDAIGRLKVMFERVCSDFETQNWSRCMAKPNTYTCSLPIHRSTRCRAWSTVSKAFPVGCLEWNHPTSRNAIGKMSCGRPVTSLPVVAAHRLASLSNTSSNKRLRSNGPYTPAMKDGALWPLRVKAPA